MGFMDHLAKCSCGKAPEVRVFFGDFHTHKNTYKIMTCLILSYELETLYQQKYDDKFITVQNKLYIKVPKRWDC